ncbi:MAG: hypothetical protein ACYC3Q_13535 [Gemmatimonadaceae bacterium]
MSAPATPVPGTAFVNALRARPGTIDLALAGTHAITIRVEMPEVWDVVRIRASPGATVREVRAAAVAALQPDAEHVDDYVVKFRGWEVTHLDETLAEVGIREGSTLLVHYCRKRPVR